MRYLSSLALLLILLAPSWVWASGRLESGAGAPYGQFETSTPVSTDQQILAVPGFLQCVFISASDSAPIEGDIVVYDNTAESGTVVFSVHVTTAYFTPYQVCPQRPMTTGIYIGFTTTSDVKVWVSYKK